MLARTCILPHSEPGTAAEKAYGEALSDLDTSVR